MPGTKIELKSGDDPDPAPPIQTDSNANFQGYEPTNANRLLDDVLGDHVHNNNGTHIKGGIQDDKRWQVRWARLVQLHPSLYEAPKGKTGRRFLSLLVDEFKGVRNRIWNSEHVIVFMMVVLQRAEGVKKSAAIQKRLETRMDMWEAGQVDKELCIITVQV